jgi:hypothetical protein
MPPPRRRQDPNGYYDRLGLEPAATPAEIVTAYRLKARLLHPDVPGTGNTNAFVALKQAYDVLSNLPRRAAYDRTAREAAFAAIKSGAIKSGAIEPGVKDIQPNRHPAAVPVGAAPVHGSPFSDRPLMVWAGLGAFLCFSVYQAVTHILALSPAIRTDIRPNAAIVAPLSPSAHQAVLYGPAPVRLAGTPNFYVMPAGSPTLLWRLDTEHNALVPLGQLPPFSAVQAVRLVRQSGMLEVRLNDRVNGFVLASHFTPGNAVAARRAYCGYNAGTTPPNGEMLQRRGYGHGTLNLENRAVQPAVVKLRDETGAVMLSVFLEPGGQAALDGLPDGIYRPEFAIGELWSRACNTFAAGMRAQRMDEALRLPGDSRLVVAPETAGAASSEISDQMFDRD